MNFNEFHFAQPLWFIALVVPLFIGWFMRHRLPSISRLRNFADAHLLPYLLLNPEETSHHRRRNYTFIVWSIVWALGVLALAGPRWDYEEQEVVKPRANLMIVLDLSESMRVRDLPHSRLEEALQNIEDLLQPDQRIYIGLVAFAGIPHLVAPLSDDYKTLRHLLHELNTDLIRIQGSRLAPTLKEVTHWMQPRQGMDKTNHVLLVSDGELDEDDFRQSVQWLKTAPFSLHTLGVGTPQGDFIPLNDNAWKKDDKGEVIISRLNEQYLQQLASAGHGTYQHADYRSEDTQSILAAVDKSVENMTQDKTLQKLWYERFYLCISLMMLLMLPWFRRPHLA